MGDFVERAAGQDAERNLRSAASKASAAPASSSGTAHNLIRSRLPDLIRRCYFVRSITSPPALAADPAATLAEVGRIEDLTVRFSG